MAERVAVIGGGVAGIVSAYLLQQKYEVTLFESAEYLGGHTNTVVMREGPDAGVAVDTGFIVCNDRTYPTFHTFLSKLGVQVRYADMSFSVYDQKSGLQYGSANLDTIFAQRSNLINPGYLKFLWGIQKFWNCAKRDVDNLTVHELPLSEYLARNNIHHRVVQDFILPISAAIWSTPDSLMLDFPVGIFLKFYSNHGLLSVVNQPRWQTVVGGSFAYVKAFQAQYTGVLKLNAPVGGITRAYDGKPTLRLTDGSSETFDYCVLATHADITSRLLMDPTTEERNNFTPWSYLRNDTVLHTDPRFLPPNKRAWASWNYRRELQDDGSRPLSITYDMNRLQGLQTTNHYCVTLNSRSEIDPDSIIARFDYTHPHFTIDSMRTQSKISGMNGQSRTFYCGSYLGFGFHEDAVKSAVHAVRHLGVAL